MSSLLRIRGFGLYLAVVFLNAMTDLGHKIVLQNSIFKAYEGSELIALTAAVNALILLPFVLLFSPAGFLGSRYAKPKVLEYAALFAVGITLLITASYAVGWFWGAFALTFVLAAQSALYSPAKYGLIKELVGSEKLAVANGVVQALTVVSILAGALIYSYFFEMRYDASLKTPSEIVGAMVPLGWLLVAASVTEYLLARKLARTVKLEAEAKDSRFSFRAYRKLDSLKSNIALLRKSEAIWLSVIGLSILWGIAQTVAAVFGELLKARTGIVDTVTAQGLLALSGVGVIVGSLFAGRMSRNYIETGLVPLGAAGVAFSLAALASTATTGAMGTALFFFGFFSGILMVPLNALIQFAAPQGALSRILAGNNFMQNVAMLLFLALTLIAALYGAHAHHMLQLAAWVATAGMLYTVYKLPQSLVRYVVRVILRLRYRVSVEGLANIPQDKGVLLLGNHISFLDWAMLQIAYPERIRFVMEREYYEIWYLKPFFKFFGVIPISSRAGKSALQAVADALKRGECVVLFPEGHLSRNGHMGEFKRGFEYACEKLQPHEAVIVPFYLRGLWEDEFSYASRKLKRNASRVIGVDFGEAIHIHSKAPEVKRSVFKLSVRSWLRYAQALPSIQEAWLARVKEAPTTLAVADSTGVELDRARFATGVFALASRLRRSIGEGRNVGVVLPSTAAGAMANMALLSLGRVIVNLNYSAGEKSLRHMLQAADIDTVVTSERFLTRLKAKGFDISEILHEKKVVTLESLKKEISKPRTLLTLLAVRILPYGVLEKLFIKRRSNDETAAILFSSGSEGMPKGIMLSHRNIMGNIKQIAAVLNPDERDVMLGTLPLFHSFGLTVTTMLPLTEGIALACHPDPTDGYGIGKLAAKYDATMLFATATFLRLYTRNRKLHPLMFQHLRLVVAGAEKLPEAVRKGFFEKFGKTVYEGYGATETTPVASVNLPDALIRGTWQVQKGNKPGTVGLPVPGSAFKIVDPETFVELSANQEGMILIGGTQIMQGYLNDAEKTAEVIKEINGVRWYVTGDKGRVDEDGFLSVVDRYSRFAKIGGEMVSLGMVEESLAPLFNASERFALAAVDDAKKGEAIVMLYEGEASEKEIKERLGQSNLNALFVPSKVFKVDAVPLLGSGKADLKGVKRLATELSSKNDIQTS
jgi:acyl-[acyl-carrier-protein]-phospholipid O-acyltransferase/long-chain-fatty-acid--[acyl-carrier-protein] ligase